MATNKNINRIKVVLVEKKKTNKWLADQIGKDQATVSKWCTNTTQPTLETLVEEYLKLIFGSCSYLQTIRKL